jgi:hypothetical protein
VSDRKLQLIRGDLDDSPNEAPADRAGRKRAIMCERQQKIIDEMHNVARHLRTDSPNRVILERAIVDASAVLQMIKLSVLDVVEPDETP